MRAATATVGSLPVPRIPAGLSARGRRRLAAAAAALTALTALYVAWFRDSSFVRVDDVTISGLSTSHAARLRAELTAAARRMTTLDVDDGALRAAVASDPLVRSVSASGDFPSTLRIDVVLNEPVAALSARGRAVAVAADGTLLPGARTGSLPAVTVSSLPRGRDTHERRTLLLVAAAAAAPPPLRARLTSIGSARGKGLVARLRNGPSIVLGDGSRLVAKWAAAATVLAQSSSAGAAYVDVHDPAQPIAGGLTLGDGAIPVAASSASGGIGVVAATPTSGPAQLPAATPSTSQAAASNAAGAAGTTTPNTRP